MNFLKILTLILITTVLLTSHVFTQEMRQLKRIRTPAKTAVTLPEGAKEVSEIKPVDRGEIKKAVQDLVSSWNTTDLNDKVSDSYFDKSRFRNNMITEVPRVATVRLLSVRDTLTLNQFTKLDSDGNQLRVSTVSVVAETQIELSDANNGFVRVPGMNELIFEVTETME